MNTPSSPLSLLKDPSLLKTDALIDGQWITGPSRFAVHDPATGLKLADVANLEPTHCHTAIVAAEKAWGPWRNKTAKERGAILMKWFTAHTTLCKMGKKPMFIVCSTNLMSANTTKHWMRVGREHWHAFMHLYAIYSIRFKWRAHISGKFPQQVRLPIAIISKWRIRCVG